MICRAVSLMTFLGSVFLFSSCQKRTFHSKTDSFTSESRSAGRWLASVAVGPGMPSQYVTALRDVLVEKFSSASGGEFQLQVDLVQTKDQKEPVSKELLLRKFAQLRNEIAQFRVANPQIPTQVILSLTGHGMEKENVYKFSLSEEELTADEIADLVASIGADETLVFLQSCYSGGLANTAFPSFVKRQKWVEDLQLNLTSRGA